MTAACTGRWISARRWARRYTPQRAAQWRRPTAGTASAPRGDINSYGNMVKLRHTTYKYGTLETLYAHLSKLCVTQGQQVREGQLIGYSGDTGNCYGAHLHFEVRWKGQRANPLNWLDNDFSTASSAVKLGSYSSVRHAKEVEYMNYAIDVSKHQGKFDWQAAYDKGIRHAMLRAGYGRYSSQVAPPV